MNAMVSKKYNTITCRSFEMLYNIGTPSNIPSFLKRFFFFHAVRCVGFSSLTRDGNAESQPLDCQQSLKPSPLTFFFFFKEKRPERVKTAHEY